MVLTAERLATDVARIRSFVGVSALVYQEVVGFGEVSLTVLADELFLGSAAGNWAANANGSTSSGGRSPFAGEALSRDVRMLMVEMLMLMLVECCTAEPLVHEHRWTRVGSAVRVRIGSAGADRVAGRMVGVWCVLHLCLEPESVLLLLMLLVVGGMMLVVMVVVLGLSANRWVLLGSCRFGMVMCLMLQLLVNVFHFQDSWSRVVVMNLVVDVVLVDW